MQNGPSDVNPSLRAHASTSPCHFTIADLCVHCTTVGHSAPCWRNHLAASSFLYVPATFSNCVHSVASGGLSCCTAYANVLTLPLLAAAIRTSATSQGHSPDCVGTAL
jgi:hypothetical protein